MKNHTFLLILFTLFLSISFCIPNGNAQKGETSNKLSFATNATCISLGWYNPTLDYCQEESEFKDADFKGPIQEKSMSWISMSFRLQRISMDNLAWILGNRVPKLICIGPEIQSCRSRECP